MSRERSGRLLSLKGVAYVTRAGTDLPRTGLAAPRHGRPWRGHPSWAVVDRLSEATGRDIAYLLLEADAEGLRATRNAQLATYALSLVVLDAARRGPLAASGRGASAAAGHSLGEYTALVAAGALEADPGARLVQARGEAMQAAADANPGTMAAVLGLELPEVASRLPGHGGRVGGQRQHAGPGGRGRDARRDGDRPGQAALGRGAKRVVALQVGGAFHSPLMAPAQGPLDAAVGATAFGPAHLPGGGQRRRPGRTPTGSPHCLSAQLCSQVRWRESLVALAALGTRLFVELGPGTELSGMVRRTLPDAARANVAGPGWTSTPWRPQ